MAQKTAQQIEEELKKIEQQQKEALAALEEAKKKEEAELKAKRLKGITDAWSKVTNELVKVNAVNPPDYDNISTESGKKRSETNFNRKAYEELGKVLGFVESDEVKPSKRKTLNDDQKKKIEELHAKGEPVKVIYKKIYSNPTTSDYQRVSNYVKKLDK